FLAPPEPKPGFATQWNGDEWVHIKDSRGLTIYDQKTRVPSVVEYVGPIKDGYTLLAPTSNFDEWNGKEWILNEGELKKHQVSTAINQKMLLIAEADSEIAALQNAIKYGMATEDEIKSLEAWEIYRIKLMRIAPENVLNITWPVKP
ncbi:TPA: tail fiber assembly protein, partial [Serratia fonticola]